MAWTSPRRTRRSMSRLATTPGKRLVMPRSSTAYGPPAPPCGASDVAIGPPRSSPAAEVRGAGPTLPQTPHVNGGWERSTHLRSQPPFGDREGHGVVGTVISPDLILSAYCWIWL